MKRKQKILASLPFLIFALAASTWIVRSAVENMVTQRSSNDTAIEIPPPPEPEGPTLASIVRSDEGSPGSTVSEETLQKLGLEKVEEEFVYYAYATPNDPIYPQWYTTTINAPTGWDTSTGSASTIVAVIDSGYALAHEDLSDAWVQNTGEQGNTALGDPCWTGTPEDKTTNACDDDGNGYVDDHLGWDFSNGDNYPQAGDNSAGGASHGTKVAGLVGARSDNSIGVAAVNWNTQIMPLQGLFDEGFGYSSDIANAIVYAVDNGADVINMSLGGPSPDSLIRAAIRYASEQGVIVVTSAGNCGEGQSSSPCIGYVSPGGMGYPARYPETIAVGATTSSDARASFSSYGAELDIVAPGSGSIQTPTWTSGNETSAYATSSYGTSFSSPIVSGLVASIKSEFPEAGKADVLAVLAGGADKVAGMGTEEWTEEYGFGRINVANTFSEIAEAEEDFNKGTGDRPTVVTDNPQVVTNIGHSNASAVTYTRVATTYCVSAANVSCELKLEKQGGGPVISLGSKLTNAQGIAVWSWDRSDVNSTGTFDATTTVNSLVSELEVLIIN